MLCIGTYYYMRLYATYSIDVMIIVYYNIHYDIIMRYIYGETTVMIGEP